MAGCASIKPAAIQTPAQVAAQVCPSLQAINTTLAVPGVIGVNDQANLAKVAPVVAKVCTDAQSASAIDVQALASKAVPVLLQLINAAPLAADQKTQFTVGITLVQAALAPAIAQWQAAEAAEASGAK